jgi:hypothetical protein
MTWQDVGLSTWWDVCLKPVTRFWLARRFPLRKSIGESIVNSRRCVLPEAAACFATRHFAKIPA